MDPAEKLDRLCHCLAGVFQNRDQALADPAWFVHFKLWIHPISLFEEDSTTFFLEQASATYPQPPYRQRVLRVRLLEGNLTAEYYALTDPQAFQGATQQPERLRTLMPEQVRSLAGSQLQVNVTAQPDSLRFEARQAPGELCQFVVNGEEKQVELAFDAIAPNASAGKAAFWMYDKGIDPQTGKATWGATNGPFKLIKIEDWSVRLPASTYRRKFTYP
jgi:hypothetical protein